MRSLFENLEKIDCKKCKHSRPIPLSDQLTCKHPLAHLQRHAGTHSQSYWPVSFDPKFLTSCPCRGFQQLQRGA